MSFTLPKDWPNDMRSTSYGKYLYAFFRGKMSEKPPQFDTVGPADDGELGNKCVQAPGAPDKLMQHQLVINMALTGMFAHGAMNRGILVYHSTGAGKTHIATGAMDAAWDTGKRIVFVTSVDALASNPPSRFHQIAKLFPRFSKESLAAIERMFSKRGVTFMSFAQLAHQLQLVRGRKAKDDAQMVEFENFLKNAVLVIDEIHNIFRPLANQKAEHDALLNFLMDVKDPRSSGLNVVVLSATPGDTPEECIMLLNMLRDPSSDPISVPDVDSPASMTKFKKAIAGLVSYVEMSDDQSRFPRLIQAAPYRLPMSMHQFVKYLDAYASNVGKDQDYESMSKANRYYGASRKYSNMLYNFAEATEDSEFSAKLPKLLEVIKEYPRQKHYVYSSFYERRGSSQGILAIAKFLEDKLGYVKLTAKEASDVLAIGDLAWKKLGERKRYILAIQSELSSSSTVTRQSRDNLSRLAQVFNSSKNSRGQFAHVFLASQGFYTAIDLKAVRHIHIFEPFLTYTADIQAIGRGRRRCSHADLHFAQEWTVVMHRYLSDMPTELRFTTPEDLAAELQDRKVALQVVKLQLKESHDQGNDDGDSQSAAANLRRARRLTSVRILSKRVQELEQQVDDLGWKEQARRLKLIDDIITDETRVRSHLLLSIYQAMREAAFDCPLYSAMHGIQCFVQT
jgi:hypothetical protein